MNVIPIMPADRPWTHVCDQGRFRVRISTTPDDVVAARRLRALAFRGKTTAADCAAEADPFDLACSHVLVEDVASGHLAGCCRVFAMPDGGHVAGSYSAQLHDLTRLQSCAMAMLEIGRFCIHPETGSHDVARLLWAAIAAIVETNAVGLIFGCTSFAGTSATPYRDVFAYLATHHRAPDRWAPAPRTGPVIALDATAGFDTRRALRSMPSPLRTYLALGAWVGGHAVVDRDLNTLHVFTGLPVAGIAPRRKQFFRLGLATDH